MDYKERYEEALDRARKLQENSNGMILKKWLWNIFPELVEPDERIREVIIGLLKQSTYEDCDYDGVNMKDIYAWLEKQGNQKLPIEKLPEEMKTIGESLGFTTQEECDGYNQMVSDLIMSDDDKGEQKPANKVEPKFKVGDWITDGQLTCKVLGVTDKSYELHLYNDDYCHFETDVQSIDKHYHLWTIKDAHDGDVLTSIGFHGNCTFIFKGLDNWKFDEPNGDRAVATGYCCLSASADKMEFGIQGPDCVEVNTVKPATKIQRNLLFQKMKEAGYEWDAEKKELKKIKQEELSVFENSLKHIIEEAIEEGDTHNLKADAELLLNLIQKPSDEDMKEALRTEYEKGRADAIAQMRKEWGEEDENKIDTIISVYRPSPKLVKWLKSIKERYTWKPSEEQMNALSVAVKHGQTDDPDALKKLLEQLKKLTE